MNLHKVVGTLLRILRNDMVELFIIKRLNFL